MITRFLVGALMLAPVAAGAQQTTPAASPAQRTTATVDSVARPAANPADVATEDAILAALYDVISGPAGKARDWDRMRSLFVPGARLIPTGIGRDGAVRHRVMTVEDYVKGSGPMLEKEGFFENEVARTTERFGNVAHAFSTYESRHKAGEAPFARGINSIQLLNDGTRWWVVTIFWDSEREGNPIPARYLPGR